MVDFPATRASRSGVHSYCKPCHNARGKASKDEVGGSRTYHLKRRYGITAAEADAMAAEQGGLCGICRAAPAAHVDHDHATGRVRQLLCFNCNGGLGQFRDDPRVLREAARYVERHGEPAPPRPVGHRPRAGAPTVRGRAAGCGQHDVVRARVAALIASMGRSADR
ncbi:endonuclease VII domain-containing protein [Blastococcus sp. SYSU D00695]